MDQKKTVRHIAKALCAVMLCGTVVTPLTACNKTKLSNADTPLTIACDVLDTVFNPFFYTSGSDGEVVSQTQIGMLTSDPTGAPAWGWDEACVALDYSMVTTGNKDLVSGNNYDNYYTDYYFAIKDNVQFSDGVYLTSDDVLFNIYMYLDPAYTGSNTMYSVAIKGLKAYRTQQTSESGQESSSSYFNSLAEARINRIIEWATNDIEGDWNDFDAYEEDPQNPTIKDDILKAHTYFHEELEADWTSAQATVDDYEKYVDANGNKIITEGWQVFLYQYGLFTIKAERVAGSNNIAYYSYTNNYEAADKSESAIIEYVYGRMVGDYLTAPKSYKDNLVSIISYYATASSLRSYVLAAVIKAELAGEMSVKTIEGVEILKNQTSIPYKDDNGVLKSRTLLDAQNSESSYDVLHITIDGIDPKAIQNFSFTVAPGHYYAAQYWDKAVAEDDYFGVEFADPDYMDAIRKMHVPLGAGPYRASTQNGSSETATIEKSAFCADNVVYMESNEHFLLGAPLIKKLRYQVVNNNMLYDAVATGTVHYASPSMTAEIVTRKLEGSDKNKVEYASADNLGYGYIGISAQFIPNINIRKAIMCTLDPQLCVDYYGGEEYASVITRPMSITLKDYYPYADAYYPYSKEEARQYLLDAGCELNEKDGYMYYNGSRLKYTFTIAGDSDDHPANSMILNSAEILNELGLEITVTHDSTALVKLAAGQLTVWAAAWSSSSDPDMYQVYHKDSAATSTKAWGYSYLTSAACAAEDYYQYNLVQTLADLIEDGRETDIVSERKAIYAEALDVLMDLAVEFPTYQRKVFYVWQKGLFDNSTIYTDKDVDTYRSPLSEIWKVSFNED